ncbi:hypothetical protein [Streptomyces sp. NPDC058424]|uniref:hypothetical protein n=1 Tax=Streptomyces sp. NPDC058424 TaxID=3346491 RepID=UPI00364DC0DD
MALTLPSPSWIRRRYSCQSSGVHRSRADGNEGQWIGHSLRRGFATAARRAGHTLERIGRHGGWADGSRALLGYMEEGDRWERNPVAGL